MSGSPWCPIACPVPDAVAFAHATNGLRVIAGVQDFDGVPWRHVSLSRADRLPDYDDMTLVKAWFFGSERDAIEYWAKKSEHVNDHPFCRHLWGREDGERSAPDFRRIDASVGRLSI